MYITRGVPCLWDIKNYKNTYVEYEGLFFFSIVIESNPNCVQSANVDEFEHCANWQGRHSETFPIFLKMDNMDEIEVVEVVDNEDLGVSYHKDEKRFEEKKVEIFDTILMNETIETAKNKLKILKDRSSDTHGVFKSFFYFFSIDQTPNYPEFIEWCVNNYSTIEGVIMNETKSSIIFPI